MTFVRTTPDQVIFRDAAAGFIESRLPLDMVRETFESPQGVDDSYIRQSADLGWYAAFVPEEFGGGSISNLPIIEAAIVSELRGRGLQPGPFISTNVVAFALARFGSQEQKENVLPGLASGGEVASWVFEYSREREPTLRIDVDSSSVRLDGRVGYVVDAETADWLLVTSGRDGGANQVLIPANTEGLSVLPMKCFDLTSRIGEVRFDSVILPVSAVIHGEVGAAESQLDVAALLTAVDSVGAMDRLVEMTVQYSLDRRAFGRPLSAFQSIKHLVADLSLMVQECKILCAAACEAFEDEATYASEVVSMAKAFVSDSGFNVAQGCLQIHGGIGFAWEHDLHLFMRRLTANSALYGDGDFHRRRLCDIHDF